MGVRLNVHSRRVTNGRKDFINEGLARGKFELQSRAVCLLYRIVRHCR